MVELDLGHLEAAAPVGLVPQSTDRSVCFAEAATHGAARAPGQTEAA